MLNKKLYISSSSIQTFLQCKKKFKYKHIDKISLSEKQPNKYLSFGNSIHLALADFNLLRNTQFTTIDVLHNLLRKNWIREGYDSREEEREFGLRGLDMLSTYHADPQDVGKENLIIEKMIYKDCKDYILCGKLDKVYKRNDDNYEILDYKTGNTVMPIDNLQLPIYLILAKEELGYYPTSMSLYYLPQNKKVIENVHEDFIRKSTDDIFQICELILQEKEFYCNSSSHCKANCEYYKICDVSKDESLQIINALNIIENDTFSDYAF